MLYPRASRKIITQRKASGLSLHQPYQASNAKRFIYWNLHQSISARTTVLDNDPTRDPTEGILIITSVLDISPQHSSLPMNYHPSRLLHAATERLDYPWFSGFEEVLNVAQIVIGRDVCSKVKRDSFTFAHIIMERGCDAYVNRFLSPFPRQSSRELAILGSLCGHWRNRDNLSLVVWRWTVSRYDWNWEESWINSSSKRRVFSFSSIDLQLCRCTVYICIINLERQDYSIDWMCV